MRQTANWLDLATIEQQLCVVTSQQLGIKLCKVKPDSRIIEDLNCDSLDAIELIMEVEEAFSVTIPDTPANPVGKLIFARQPFRIRDLAEYVFLNQGTGVPVRRKSWRHRPRVPVSESRTEFTHLGGRLDSDSLSEASIYEKLDGPFEFARFRRQTDGMVCIQLPESEVLIGCEDELSQPDEHPPHRVTLSSFLIDVEPISVVAFCRFLNSIDATDRERQKLIGLDENDDRETSLQFEWQDECWRVRNESARQPVVMVSWFAANAYSLWANGFDWRDQNSVGTCLPSEAQWEYASQGAYKNLERVMAAVHRPGEHYQNGQLPLPDVQEPYGESRFGLRHMSGTIWHWCRDSFDANFYRDERSKAANPVSIMETGLRSERGGSWVGPIELCRESYRRGRNPSAKGRCLGFRCVATS
ncbi:SUMF1/EgtB/PvdO family nonheme iron enzyme [Stieleria sp. JC731]|uniref:SUMF1/EgtB/PvdO family nonheme iron enzyme n=1 Tax=Pirellulaceae TaxID=2691357 RepID=UPI001E3A71A8|nr:SUMF1/EgtB/PvdO family nonheme iron enzyme [Stieleria sp. JC731]MCC9600789.1 SUMF1/EgtB/PvdO family nonheme iron enzyme [Stieleria sp. JC731]